MKTVLLIILLLFVSLNFITGDTYILHNGEIITGETIEIDNDYYHVSQNNQMIKIEKESVSRVITKSKVNIEDSENAQQFSSDNLEAFFEKRISISLWYKGDVPYIFDFHYSFDDVKKQKFKLLNNSRMGYYYNPGKKLKKYKLFDSSTGNPMEFNSFIDLLHQVPDKSNILAGLVSKQEHGRKKFIQCGVSGGVMIGTGIALFYPAMFILMGMFDSIIGMPQYWLQNRIIGGIVMPVSQLLILSALIPLILGLVKYNKLRKLKGRRIFDALNEYNWHLRKKNNIPLNLDIMIEKEKLGISMDVYI